MTRPRVVKLDRDGVPIDANDWDYEDWRILWEGIKAIKAAIAARHAAKGAKADEEDTDHIRARLERR